MYEKTHVCAVLTQITGEGYDRMDTTRGGDSLSLSNTRTVISLQYVLHVLVLIIEWQKTKLTKVI